MRLSADDRPLPSQSLWGGMQGKQTEINGGVDIHMAQWAQDRAKALIAQGMSDKDVAQIVGVTRNTICSWRYRNGIAPGSAQVSSDAAEKRADAGVEPVSVPPCGARAQGGAETRFPPSVPPPAPDSGPIELCLELDGGWARLRAHSWKQAAKLWGMLQTCVKALDSGVGADG